MSEVPLRLVFERRGARRAVPVRDLLDAELRETVAGEANAWVKGLREVRVDGTPLRDRFCHRGDSLWWFTELFLHKEARILRWLEIVRAVGRGLDQHGPERVSAEGGTVEDRYVAATVIASRAGGTRAPGVPTAWCSRLRDQARARFYTWSALVSRARMRASGDDATPGIPVAFVHSAFWRRGSPAAPEGEEGYIGPVIEALQSSPGIPGVTLVGVGPRLNFRARSWWHGVTAPALDAGLPLAPIEGFADAKAIRPSLELWRRCPDHEASLRNSPEVREGARLGGHDLWPLVSGELSKIVWLQWPWSARAMDEAGAAMDRLAPPVVLTYAEAGGWGRAIMLEARRRGIPSAGLQHGFIYRHWLNYLHEPDEMAPSVRNPADPGFPRPTLTLLFDRYAESHLRTAGHFPPESLTVTGSPRLDDLVFRANRLTEADHAETRRQLGATQGDAVVLVVTKYTQIRYVFRRVAEASSRIPGVRLVVKCHPAETPEPYARDAAGMPHVVMAPASVDLARLLAVSRALVTVNSTVAIDALLLGVPSLVVDLPNNLSPFVEAGVMAGALTPTGIDQALPALIADTPARARLLAGRQPFLERHRIAADGGAAQRAAAAILSLASREGLPPYAPPDAPPDAPPYAPPYAVRRTPYAVRLIQSPPPMLGARTLLINPPPVNGIAFTRQGRCQEREEVLGTTKPPYTLAVIAALLRQRGVEVRLIDQTGLNLSSDAVVARLRTEGFAPTLIVFPSTTPTLEADAEEMAVLKRAFGAPAFCFGPHASTVPLQAMEKAPQVDGMFVGEPEDAVQALVALPGLDQLGDIPSLVYRRGGTVVPHRAHGSFTGFPAMPVPAWDLLDLAHYTLPLEGKPYVMVETSRGCPYTCDFCVAPIHQGHRFRERPASQLVDEIERAKRDLGVEHFYLWGDTVTLNAKSFTAFCDELIARHLDIRWFGNARADNLTKLEYVERIRASGCWMLSMGIESASDDTRISMEKKLEEEKIRLALDNLRKVGIKSFAFFIYGYPGETVASMERTTRYAVELDPDFANFYPAVPYPGTELYEKCRRDGLLADEDWTKMEYSYYVIRSGELSSDTVMRAIRQARRRFFLRPRYLARHAADIPRMLATKPHVVGEILTRFLFGHAERARPPRRESEALGDEAVSAPIR